VASEALEIQDAVPHFVPCPLCGQVDGVRRVPVAHDEACAEFPPRLVDELAVVPRREKRSGRVLGAGAASVAGVLFGAGLVGVGTGDPGESVFMAVCFLACGALASICSVGVIGVSRRQARLARGLAAAEEVWRQGWYCRRCDIVYFQPGYAPAGINTRVPLATGEFRRIVFAAGGYEDLA
jgi:hypothetical protein